MDERGANIDLVFRNGLKDFEVLPPQEVWNNIQPAIKVKPRSFILLRTAAMIAIVLSLSFLTYKMSKEVSTVPDSPVLTFNIDSFSPVINPVINEYSSSPSVKTPVFTTGNSKIIVTPLQKPLIETEENPILSEGENTYKPEVLTISRTNILSFGSSYSLSGPVLTNMTGSNIKSIEVKPVVQQYIPESSIPNNTEKWSIGAMASPTYYSTFSSGKNGISHQIANAEQSLISYSGGVSLSYKLNKRLSVQTGLYYSSLGQEIDGINSFGGFQKYDYTKGDHNFAVLTTSGTIFTNNADVFLISTSPDQRILTAYTNDVFDPNKANLEYINNTLIQNFSFLELPVVLRYKIVDKAVDINLIGGLSYNMMVNNSVYTMVDGGKYSVGTTEGLNMLNVSSSLGMGMEYSFSKKLSFNLEPTFRYYLNPFNEFNGSTTHPYSFGVFSGISYKF
jgi:hypothetical protein